MSANPIDAEELDYAEELIAKGRREPEVVLTRVCTGDVLAAMALTHLLLDHSTPMVVDDPAVVCSAVYACARKFAAAPAVPMRKAFAWYYLIVPMGEACMTIDAKELSEPSSTVRELFVKRVMPFFKLLDQDIGVVTEVLRGARGTMMGELDLRPNLAKTVSAICMPWAANEWGKLGGIARCLAQFGQDQLLAELDRVMRYACAAALRQLVTTHRALSCAIATDPSSVGGIMAFARSSAADDVIFLVLLATLQELAFQECGAGAGDSSEPFPYAPELVRGGIMGVVAEALARADRCTPEFAQVSSHMYALAMCAFCITAPGASRAAWKAGIVPHLLTKLVSGTTNEKTGVEMIIQKVLLDADGLRKHGSNPETLRLLEEAVAVPSGVQEALNVAALHAAAIGEVGDEAQMRCSNPACPKGRDVSPSELTKCSGCLVVYYCGRECQRADWRVHKVSCKEMQARFKESQTGNPLEYERSRAEFESDAAWQRSQKLVFEQWLLRELDAILSRARGDGIAVRNLIAFVDFADTDEGGKLGRCRIFDESQSGEAECGLLLTGTSAQEVLSGILAERREQVAANCWEEDFPIAFRHQMPSGAVGVGVTVVSAR